MARGTPDYFRTIRQVFGAAKLITGSKKVAGSATTELIKINGKGMLYGGFFGLDYTSAQDNSAVIIEIDGATIAAWGFKLMIDWGVIQAGATPMNLLKYDPINYIYSVGIGFGLTFEESVLIKYYETYGTTPTIFFDLVYALLE